MNLKLFEVRDRATMIPVLAIKLYGGNFNQQKLLHHAGYHPNETYILLLHLVSFKFHYDSHAWGDRTLGNAHHFIEKNFDSMVDGQVVDIEYILQETSEPKKSDLIYSDQIEQLEKALSYTRKLLRKTKQ